MRGKHVWYELLTTDPEAAEGFYNAVVGWGTQPFSDDNPYKMWTAGERPIGGRMELPEEARAAGAPPHWLAHIATADVDATAARAEELGGGVVTPPQDIPEVGRFATLRDPFGAGFFAFTPSGDSPQPEGRPGHGEFSWHELMTDDHERAFDFYSSLFGWEKGEAMDMGEHGVYQLFREGGADEDLGGMMNRPKEMPVSAWIYYVNVEDLDGAVEAVEAHGGTVMNGPMEVPGGDRVAQCMDPQGAVFALHEYGAGSGQ